MIYICSFKNSKISFQIWKDIFFEKKLIRELLKIQFSNKSYKPSYWLFEGQAGGKYSDRSIQQVLRNAVEVSGGNP